MLKSKKIVNIETLLFNREKQLSIPCYQRPYRWSKESANRLFLDILDALKENNKLGEYRLGSVILHETDNSFDIVDGQQRITTLLLILKCLGSDGGLPNIKYRESSFKAIKENYAILKANIDNMEDKNTYKDFLLNKCSVVEFITDTPEEAFQFFDSQNSRGKELKPHDLLKAYHLREMKNETEVKNQDDVIKTVEKWESKDEEYLARHFNNVLYPLTRWYKNKDGLYFNTSKIDTFKGIKTGGKYQYIKYHELVYKNLKENNNGEMFFQLTQPILAGQRFFEYVFYYAKLSEETEKTAEKFNNELDIVLPNYGNGDRYTKRLFKNVLIFFADKFGIENIDEMIYKKIFCWSYFIRIALYAVYQESINRYALGKHEYNNEINIFEKIYEMKSPKEIFVIPVNKIEKSKNEGYKELYEKISKFSGWENDK